MKKTKTEWTINNNQKDIDPNHEYDNVDYEKENEFYYSLINGDGWIIYEDENQHLEYAGKAHTRENWSTTDQLHTKSNNFDINSLSNMVNYEPNLVFFKKNPNLVYNATKLEVFTDEECDRLINHHLDAVAVMKNNSDLGTENGHQWPVYRWDKHINDSEERVNDLKQDSSLANMNSLESDLEYDIEGDHKTWRKSDTNWLSSYQYDMEWVFEKLDKLIQEVNEKYFKFDLSIPSSQEPIQVTYYPPGGVYEWHTDWSALSEHQNRKLSYVIQLSDSSEYTGGNLQLKTSRADWMNNMARKRGSVTFFPSFITHRASVVTSGERFSGVGWVHGNAWR